ncbi:MAG: hypothetical protein ACM3WV_02775 [Bacillota bacterium]
MNGYGREGVKYLGIGVSIWLMIAGIRTEAGFNLSGSFYHACVLRGYELSGSRSIEYGGEDALRLSLKYLPNRDWKLEGSFDLMLLSGDNADAYIAVSPEAEEDSFEALGLVLVPRFHARKLYLSYYDDRYTATLGRQIINYGVGYIFSPIDCFSTVELQDIGLARKGSDIARVQAPLGDLSGIEGVTTLHGADNASAVKIFGNLMDYDLSLTGIYKGAQKEALLGFTFKGDLFNTGIHGELVEHYRIDAGAHYFEGMLGADYSLFGGKVLVLAEYYYNGDPIDPQSLTPEELLDLNRAFLGRNYLFGQAYLFFDEIRNLGLSVIYNPSVKSWTGTLQFAYNIMQNTDLFMYARHYRGDLNGMDAGDALKSELGARMEWKF